MTTVGWLQDYIDVEEAPLGGAELSAKEFYAAAPNDVEIIPLSPGKVIPDLDRYVVHNCVSYGLEDFLKIEEAKTVKYWHDVGPHVNAEVIDWIDQCAQEVYCSPLQAKVMNDPHGICIPPALDLEPFRKAGERSNGERRGSVTVGAWMNWGKTPQRALEVAPDVEFYGSGPCAPAGSVAIDYEAMPELLARYKTFIHLPSVLEPFGRAVVEAWAAGCKIITNSLVGSRHWIREEPDKLETAGSDFWDLVTA